MKINEFEVELQVGDIVRVNSRARTERCIGETARIVDKKKDGDGWLWKLEWISVSFEHPSLFEKYKLELLE